MTSNTPYLQTDNTTTHPGVPEGDANQTGSGLLDGALRKILRAVQAFQTPGVFWTCAAILIALGVISRFAFLSDKAFHHDESLHAYYSDRVAQGFPHEYSALLHGPFLYYCVGAFLFVFGSSDFTARLPAALFGALLVASPLLVRRLVGPLATLCLMALFLTSPTLWYFGRFLREDAFVSIWVVGTIFGSLLFWQTKKPWAAYFVTAMMAFHFSNKENSYLHAFLWLLALGVIGFVSRRLAPARQEVDDAPIPPLGFSKSDVAFFALNCLSIFVTIYVLFYSSFFKHSKGALHGIIDGLYRESLLYWWDQNQKRRIDGPFDYHLPILANYEFFLLPFLGLAWARVVTLSRKAQAEAAFFLTSAKGIKPTVILAVGLVAATFLLPRVAFVKEACDYTSVCLDTTAPWLGALTTRIAKPIHIAHSRHLLQILSYIACGGVAFFAALHLRRKFDAFLWFWLTGALGVYSYVGEKVPWLTVYIVLPLVMICGLEIARVFSRQGIVLDESAELSYGARGRVEVHSLGFSRRILAFSAAWILLALPFTLYKGLRVSFENADNPVERLVFTQTTHQAKRVRDRWQDVAEKRADGKVRVTMHGDATWPFAWYAGTFRAADFVKPEPKNAENFDAILLDHGLLEEAKRNYPGFDIYSLPLRAWWVPGQNPDMRQIFDYFFTNTLYPRTPTSSPSDTGVGDTQVLYLERASSDLAALGRPEFLKLLAPVRGAQSATAPTGAEPLPSPAPGSSKAASEGK